MGQQNKSKVLEKAIDIAMKQAFIIMFLKLFPIGSKYREKPWFLKGVL